ncbi:MAG: class I SAM-dependent methyltransferase [Pseudomonadota bacterium]|nr:class I SAM-dependent methyltransferase [Pseudomonadota bacterium]
MSDLFYRDFEDRYRGSRELIFRRLSAYLPFLRPLKTVDSIQRAFDFGCGRGEWLELIQQNGFKATGVDLDDGMLESCRERGLDTEKADLIEYLNSLEPESCVLVSAFHVVEHIRFEDLRRFVQGGLRVLKPGGLLIMETPNPDNILVATRNFYLDPTHRKPIPSDLLSFVAENAGFRRVKTLGLQEPGGMDSKRGVDLRDVLSGVSPDYAVVAQKDASSRVLDGFDMAFSRDYGISLDNLLTRRDLRIQRMETAAVEARSRSAEATTTAGEARSLALAAKAKAEEADAKNAELVALLRAETARVEALLSSTSWRATAPLRYVGSAFRALRAESLRGAANLFIRHGALYVSRRPGLRRAVLSLLNRFPVLKARLRRRAFPSVTMRHAPVKTSVNDVKLTRRGVEILGDLKAAVESDNRENH